MRSSLKDQPQFDGKTSYCDKSFGFDLENTQSPKLGTKRFGKLSTSPETIGLPYGMKGSSTITYPDIFRQGSPLPRPYDRVDNGRMQSLWDIHGFGRRRSKRKSRRNCKKCGKSKPRKSRSCKSRSRKRSRKRSHKRSRKLRRRSVRRFGTPGTKSWVDTASEGNYLSNKLNASANEGELKPVKELTTTVMQKNNEVNLPALVSNNQENAPGLRQFGRKKHRFGPNVVGYEKPMPIYHGGANTINFATNKLFNPNIINSVGKVQPDGMTPNAWLTQSKGVGDGLGNRYRFGKQIYTPDGATYGSGYNVIMQPGPSFQKTKPIQPLSASYGKPSTKPKPNPTQKKKKLTTCFGGATITLSPNGNIRIAKT